MYLYNFQPSIRTLGQGGPLVSVVGGVQQLSSEAAQALQTIFLGRYPQLTGSWSAATGATAPAFDQNADLWGYIASSTSPDPNVVNQTVYDQLQSMQDMGLFLVDTASAQAALSGQPVNVVYAIAKNQAIAGMVAGPGGSLARILPPGGTQPGTAPGATPKKKSAAPAVAAGLGLAALIAIIASAA